MNIFYLHSDPQIAAQAMTNKHVVKMILESAQMLSTAHHVLDGDQAPPGLYKVTHINHPSTVWVRQSIDHYKWLYRHFIALCNEYTDRYGKIHLTERKLSYILATPPRNIPHQGFVSATPAMPNEYKTGDSISSYLKYYQAEKLHSQVDIDRYNKVLML